MELQEIIKNNAKKLNSKLNELEKYKNDKVAIRQTLTGSGRILEMEKDIRKKMYELEANISEITENFLSDIKININKKGLQIGLKNELKEHVQSIVKGEYTTDENYEILALDEENGRKVFKNLNTGNAIIESVNGEFIIQEKELCIGTEKDTCESYNRGIKTTFTYYNRSHRNQLIFYKDVDALDNDSSNNQEFVGLTIRKDNKKFMYENYYPSVDGVDEDKLLRSVVTGYIAGKYIAPEVLGRQKLGSINNDMLASEYDVELVKAEVSRNSDKQNSAEQIDDIEQIRNFFNDEAQVTTIFYTPSKIVSMQME